MPRTILDSGQLPSTVTASAGTTNIFVSASLSLDGSTRIKLEFQANNFLLADCTVNVEILDNGVLLKKLFAWEQPSGGSKGTPGYGAAFITPSAGSHVYTFRFNVVGSGATEIDFGWYRISEAPAEEIAYVPRSTSFVNGDAQPVFSSGALSFDGATRVRLDVFCPYIKPLNKKGSGSGARWTLKDNGVSVGDLGGYQYNSGFLFTFSFPVFLTRFLTPTAGSHTYTIELTNVNTAQMGSSYFGGYLRLSDPTIDLI